jgi:hypothetical protein
MRRNNGGGCPVYWDYRFFFSDRAGVQRADIGGDNR